MSDDLKKQIKDYEDRYIPEPKPTLKRKFQPFDLAVELSGGVLAGVLIGVIGDKYFNSSPYLLLLGMLIGILASVKNIFRLIKRNNGA